jgi:hypothetical protein
VNRMTAVLGPLLALAGTLLAGGAVAGCGGTQSAAGTPAGLGGGGEPLADLSNVKPVTGNVQVTLRLTPAGRQVTTIALVNESSETGRKLSTGRATSAQIRVLDDLGMGRLIAELNARGFAANSSPGMTLENLRDYSGRRGVIIVDDGGSTRGIDFGTGTGGGALPNAYVECKKLIMGVHGALQGFEVRASTDAADDPERQFGGGTIKMNRP